MSATPASITVDLDVPANRPSIPIAVATTTVDVQLTNNSSIVTGWSFRETTGAAGATLRLVDGHDPNGGLIAAISLPSGAAQVVSIAPGGIRVQVGIYVDIVSGSIEGAVWVRWSNQ